MTSGYMPSEIARLVLGYLKTEQCMKSYNAFVRECTHLQEYNFMLKQGREYPTSIMGKSLKEMLDTYSKLAAYSEPMNDISAKWKQLELLLQDIKVAQKSKIEMVQPMIRTGGRTLKSLNRQNVHVPLPTRSEFFVRSTNPSMCNRNSAQRKNTDDRNSTREEDPESSRRVSRDMHLSEESCDYTEISNDNNDVTNETTQMVAGNDCTSLSAASDMYEHVTRRTVGMPNINSNENRKVNNIDTTKNKNEEEDMPKITLELLRQKQLPACLSRRSVDKDSKFLVSTTHGDKKGKGREVTGKKAADCGRSEMDDEDDQSVFEEMGDNVLPSEAEQTPQLVICDTDCQATSDNNVVSTVTTSHITPQKDSFDGLVATSHHSEFMTPCKQTRAVSSSDDVLFTPGKRKTHPPKKRSFGTEVIPEPKASVLSDQSLGTDSGAEGATDLSVALEQLLTNQHLAEKLAENINKVVIQKSGTGDESDDNNKFKDSEKSLDDILNNEVNMSDDTINDVIAMTETDPVFDSLFNLFNMDKHEFIEKEYMQRRNKDDVSQYLAGTSEDMNTPPHSPTKYDNSDGHLKQASPLSGSVTSTNISSGGAPFNKSHEIVSRPNAGVQKHLETSQTVMVSTPAEIINVANASSSSGLTSQNRANHRKKRNKKHFTVNNPITSPSSTCMMASDAKPVINDMLFQTPTLPTGTIPSGIQHDVPLQHVMSMPTTTVMSPQITFGATAKVMSVMPTRLPNSLQSHDFQISSQSILSTVLPVEKESMPKMPTSNSASCHVLDSNGRLVAREIDYPSSKDKVIFINGQRFIIGDPVPSPACEQIVIADGVVVSPPTPNSPIIVLGPQKNLASQRADTSPLCRENILQPSSHAQDKRKKPMQTRKKVVVSKKISEDKKPKNKPAVVKKETNRRKKISETDIEHLKKPPVCLETPKKKLQHLLPKPNVVPITAWSPGLSALLRLASPEKSVELPPPARKQPRAIIPKPQYLSTVDAGCLNLTQPGWEPVPSETKPRTALEVLKNHLISKKKRGRPKLIKSSYVKSNSTKSSPRIIGHQNNKEASGHSIEKIKEYVEKRTDKVLHYYEANADDDKTKSSIQNHDRDHVRTLDFGAQLSGSSDLSTHMTCVPQPQAEKISKCQKTGNSLPKYSLCGNNTNNVKDDANIFTNIQSLRLKNSGGEKKKSKSKILDGSDTKLSYEKEDVKVKDSKRNSRSRSRTNKSECSTKSRSKNDKQEFEKTLDTLTRDMSYSGKLLSSTSEDFDMNGVDVSKATNQSPYSKEIVVASGSATKVDYLSLGEKHCDNSEAVGSKMKDSINEDMVLVTLNENGQIVIVSDSDASNSVSHTVASEMKSSPNEASSVSFEQNSCGFTALSSVNSDLHSSKRNQNSDVLENTTVISQQQEGSSSKATTSQSNCDGDRAEVVATELLVNLSKSVGTPSKRNRTPSKQRKSPLKSAVGKRKTPIKRKHSTEKDKKETRKKRKSKKRELDAMDIDTFLNKVHS